MMPFVYPEFNHIYKELDIKLIERGESFYQKLMDKVVVDCEAKGVVVLEEGRKLIFPPNVPIPVSSQLPCYDIRQLTFEIASVIVS
jgi:arginyl-tRNA synthetase